MGNIREERRKERLNKIKAILRSAKKTNTKIDKKYLIALIMDENTISKRTATEDVEAMILIIGMEEERENKNLFDNHEKNEKK